MNSQKYPFLCCDQFDSILIWDQYGYWHDSPYSTPPNWYNEENRKKVKAMIEKLSPPDLILETETKKCEPVNDRIWGADYVMIDSNNPHIENHKSSVIGCATEQSALNYAKNNYYNLKRLYDGDVEALLKYKRTGVACLPNWNTNAIDTYGYNHNGKNRVPRCAEVNEDGTINFRPLDRKGYWR